MKAFCFFLVIIALQAPACLSAAEPQIVGWAEHARIYPGNVLIKAKVDTGAGHTSIDAQNITFIDRQGRKIIRFEVDNRQGQKVTLERDQVGIEVVPRHFGEFEERPLVILGICLGNDCRETLVNLVDRSRLKYPLLIGRSFLLDRIVVNPSAKYVVEPRSEAPVRK